MKPKTIAAIFMAGIIVLGTLLAFNGLVGYNDLHEFQIHQSLTGKVTVIDTPGPYIKGFGSVWTYPITLEAEYTQTATRLSPADDSISVTFNDGGTAKISSYVKIAMPTTAEQRLRVHREFSGNPANIVASTKSHLTNCIKASGPVMSASENQAARKAEFNQIIEDQLGKGLFKMRRHEIELDDLAEVTQTADGKTVEKRARVMATEIVNDKDGRPIVIQGSPLANYGFSIVQFSITETEYDDQTRNQFATKKESYLKAEQAKAQRQEEVQQRLMIEEKGRRQVADVQAEQNQIKERALIQADQAAEVAVIAKKEAVTKAAQRTEVAEQSRLEAEKMRDIARIKAETAELEKKALISAAQAQQQALEIGGGLSQRDRELAIINKEREIGVAEALSKVNVPSTVICGGEGKGGSINESLMNLVLLQSSGVIKNHPVTMTAPPVGTKFSGK